MPDVGSAARGHGAIVPAVDPAAVLELYDTQMRRGVHPDDAGVTIERHDKIVAWFGVDADDWAGVVWSDLDESDADEVIADIVDRLRARTAHFEWKYFAYDRPVDLPRRLAAAGLKPDPEESVMVAEIAALDLDVGPPDGVELRWVTDEADVASLVSVHDEVFGTPHSAIGRTIERSLGIEPAPVAAVTAWAGDLAISAARVEMPPGVDFAGLWGGGTLPEWRGRGVYRATIAFRGRLARERGYRFLQVDALPPSRRILERLGFVQLTTTTPFVPREG